MYQTFGMVEGAVIGGLVGLCMYPVMIAMAKKKQQTGQATGNPSVRDVHWPGSFDEAIDRAVYLLQQEKAKVIRVDRGQGIVLAGTGANLRSTGSTVHVFVRPHPHGFQVAVQVAPTMSVFDSGFSRAFANRFIEKWMALGPPRGGSGTGQFVV